jgi:MFS transporter, DHA1 family, multidrug resistance protein
VGVLPSLFVVVASLGFILPNATALALTNYPRTAAPLVGVLGAKTALLIAVVMAALKPYSETCNERKRSQC